MGAAGRRKVETYHSLAAAAGTIMTGLNPLLGAPARERA
jgi:hypothetical protein